MPAISAADEQWVDAKWIQARCSELTPDDIPSCEWIRQNVPGRRKWSHKRVRWPRSVVENWMAGRLVMGMKAVSGAAH